MIEYNGIHPDGLFLLADNRLKDSKSFYESIKPELDEKVLEPLRQIANALSPDMVVLDGAMLLAPRQMTSRIRRDTRLSSAKHMYRDNVWIRFGRRKSQYPFTPEFWFGVDQTCFSYGIGHYYTPAKFMEAFRAQMLEKPKECRKAIKKAEKAGFSFDAQRYVREKPGNIADDLKTYYNMKNTSASLIRTDFETIKTDKIIHELRAAYKELHPLYCLLLETKEYMEE